MNDGSDIVMSVSSEVNFGSLSTIGSKRQGRRAKNNITDPDFFYICLSSCYELNGYLIGLDFPSLQMKVNGTGTWIQSETVEEGSDNGKSVVRNRHCFDEFCYAFAFQLTNN